MNGAQQSGSTTSTNAPYAPYQPYIGTAFGQAGNLLQSGGPQYYTGQQVAGFNPVQDQGFKGITGAANATGGLNATNQFDKSLLKSGGGSNPYEDAMFQQELQTTQPQLASEFAGSGRGIVGSEALRAQQAATMGSQFYGNQYQGNMQNALQAGNQAQGVYNTRIGGQQQVLGAGNQIQNQSQNLIDASKAGYDYNQNLPYQNLNKYEGELSQLMPGTGQQSNPYFTNPGANTLGMLLGGEQLYKGMGSKPSQSGGSSGGSSWGGIPFQ